MKTTFASQSPAHWQWCGWRSSHLPSLAGAARAHGVLGDGEGDFAPAVLVPGDPKRARYIAETFFDAGARLVNDERGELGYTGTYRGRPLSVQSVGMGGASAAIYYTELTTQLGATRLVRVGTAGGLKTGLHMGDTVVAVSATSDDPMIDILTGGDPHAPTADWRLVELSARLARERGEEAAKV